MGHVPLLIYMWYAPLDPLWSIEYISWTWYMMYGLWNMLHFPQNMLHGSQTAKHILWPIEHDASLERELGWDRLVTGQSPPNDSPSWDRSVILMIHRRETGTHRSTNWYVWMWYMSVCVCVCVSICVAQSFLASVWHGILGRLHHLFITTCVSFKCQLFVLHVSLCLAR